ILVIVLGILAAVGLVQWRKVRLAEAEHDYKRALLDKGMTPADIEKTLAAQSPGRRGLLEQFGALSAGGKVGGGIGLIVGVSVLTGCISSVIHSQAFYSHVREQNAMRAPVAEVQPAPVEKLDKISGHAFYLDLQPIANQKLTDFTGENGHSLAEVRRGRSEF